MSKRIDMDKMIDILIAVLKKSPIITLGIAAAATIILVFPDSTAKSLGFHDVRESHKWVFSIVMILAWCMCFSYACFFIGRVIKNNLKGEEGRKSSA